MRKIIKIALPIFNAYICMFGVVGIYVFSGGSIKNRVGFLIIPLIVAMVYGAYIGYKATEKLD